MGFTKIENEDLVDIGVIGLSDKPGLSTAAMQAKLEETSRSVVIPKHNALIDELEDTTSAANLGASPVTGRASSPNVQAVMEKISTDLKTVEDNLVQDTYKSVKVGATTLTASGADTLELEAGSNITLTPDDTTNPKKITIASSGGGTGSANWGSIGGTLSNQTDLQNALNAKANSSHTHTKSQITDFPSLATVATSGSYNDLSNKPTIPTVTDTYDGTSSDAMSGKAVKSAIDAIDGTITGSPATSKTLSAFSQTDGAVSATFSDISITKSQVSDLGTIPTDLDDLSDVTVSTPSNGQVLTYDSSSSKWKNANASGGSGDTFKTITSAGTSFVASGEDTFKINAGSNVTITALSSPDKGIQISATGGGQSTGDMLMSDYDSAGDVKTAGGIDAYVATAISGKQDIISGGNGIDVTSNTVSVDFGTVASGTTTKPPTGKAVYDAIAALDATITGTAGTSKTLSAFSQTDGKVTATFSDISITKSQVSDLPTIPTVTSNYSSTGTDAVNGTAVNKAIQTLDVSDSAVSGQYVSAVSETDGKISVTRASLPTVPDELKDLTGDVSISSPLNNQVLQYESSSSKWKNKTFTGGHTMIDNSNLISAMNTAITEGVSNDDVVSAYGVGKWSNVDRITLWTTVAKDADCIGAWNDTWETDGVRTGWIYHSLLAGVLSNNNVDMKIEFDPSASEPVSLAGWRIDDSYTYSGNTVGCIAIKLNAPVQNAGGIKVAVVLDFKRTEVINVGTIS